MHNFSIGNVFIELESFSGTRYFLAVVFSVLTNIVPELSQSYKKYWLPPLFMW